MLRGAIICSPARLNANFLDEDAGKEPYFKVEQALPAGQLAPLEAALCPLEVGAMLQAARLIFRYYQAVAPSLARAHGLTYQADLEQILKNHLEGLEA